MRVVEYRPDCLPSLTRLINEHVAAIPPGFTFTPEQIDHIVARGGALWDMHYPPEPNRPPARTLCVLEHGEVVAAAQWVLPAPTQTAAALLWIVAHPDQHFPLQTLLHLMESETQASGSQSIEFSRCSFGIGWFGIPATWTHIIQTMLDSGYVQTGQWLIMYGATTMEPEAVTPRQPDLKLYWKMNKPALEWTLTGYAGETQIAECEVWGAPDHLEGCPGFTEWVSLEWIEVLPEYRRRGIARRLVAEQMRFHRRRGVEHMLAWTERDNHAARRLNEALGFVSGPELAVLRKALGGDKL